VRQERNRPGTPASLDQELAAHRARHERPRFARLHASIIERQSDWGWQNSFDGEPAAGDVGRLAAPQAETGLSARQLWFGGIAFALLAAGAISALATVQSGLLLQVETWARGDLAQRATIPGALPRDAAMADWMGGAPERARLIARPAPDRQGGEIDAALASHPGGQPPDVDIAVLGPILSSAAAAARLAADWPVPPLAAQAGADGRSEGPLREPPRPVLKPTLLSSFRPEPDTTDGRRSRR
jgi:hypothetical protein